MIIFISGSVNAGKSTTSKLVAEKIGAEWVDVDEIAHAIPDFSLARDIPQALDNAIKHINNLTNQGKNVVANYVLRQEDYEQLAAGLDDLDQHFFTLAPRLEIARSDRGRGMSEWEYDRIKYHYDTGIASPGFGKIIDTSYMTVDEVANIIIQLIDQS
jgi:cytidylate kinase